MRKNKGITLIALVITIIVLLILAAVSIATLTGENGILTQANKAKVETRGASVEEECRLWKANQEMDKQTTEGTAQTLDELLNSLENRNLITAEERATIKETGEITIGSRTINFGKEEPPMEKPGKPAPETGLFTVSSTINGKEGTSTNPTIPEGFKPVDEGLAKWGNEESGPTESAVDEGLVIEDKDGNQFVWVPVNFSEFKREDFHQEITQGEFVTDKAGSGYYEPNKQSEKSEYVSQDTLDEVKEMYQSVEINGGFYIGRYEAGAEGGKLEYSDESHAKWTETPKVVCKKSATVYNWISWGTNMTNEEGGAVELARGFAEQQGYTSVKSTLCYGVQWDAVMKWMSGIENPNVSGKKYIEDSTGMGWFKNNSNNEVKNTGIDIGDGENNKSNKVKNIYDMAGNEFEWTMEVYSTDRRVGRGASYSDDSSLYSASDRGYDRPGNAYNGTGFRPALYLNLDSE